MMPWKNVPVGTCTVCEYVRELPAKSMCRRCYARLWSRKNKGEKPSTIANVERRTRLIKEGRERIVTAKDVPCTDCGKTYPSYVMDFDHVRGEKSFNLSNAGARKLERIQEEIDKCDVVCSNCHRIRTHERGQYLIGLAAANAAIQARMKVQVM